MDCPRREGEGRGDHFQFGLVFIKKSNQSKIFFLKKTETGSNRLVSVQFFRPKTGSNWFGSVFQFDSVLAQFFSDLNLGLFWFDCFGFRLIKPKPNYTD
jgi:hypothetical protein